MATFIEIHALQTVPPSNLNRDDTGAPKSAMYGGVARARVSSQSWKQAVRQSFNEKLDPSRVGTRTRLLPQAVAQVIAQRRPDLQDQAQSLGESVISGLGLKIKSKPKKAADAEAAAAETEYLVFLSQLQIEALADVAIEAADSGEVDTFIKQAKVKQLVNTQHSIDLALFGRMVANSTDLNVDGACQFAHAISVHEANPEFDFYTAVDDFKSRSEDEVDAGAGMMGTTAFTSSTLYRYAAVNLDQLEKNLGSGDATSEAVQAFLEAFVESMPTGKINSFGNGTRPAVVMITRGSGQPASLVGAFEQPIQIDVTSEGAGGHLTRAVAALAQHAQETFSTWRRPEAVYISGLPSAVGELAGLGEVVPFVEATQRVSAVSQGSDQ